MLWVSGTLGVHQWSTRLVLLRNLIALAALVTESNCLIVCLWKYTLQCNVYSVHCFVFSEIHTKIALSGHCDEKQPEHGKYSTLRYSTLRYITVHYITVQYITVQYSTVHYNTVHYSTVHYSTLQYSTLQYSTVHYSTVLYSTVQYSTLRYITVHYITLQWMFDWIKMLKCNYYCKDLIVLIFDGTLIWWL